MANEKVVTQCMTRDLFEEIVGCLVKAEIILNDGHAFFGVAHVDLRMEREPVQGRFGKAMVAGQGGGDLARTARQHELKAHGFDQHRQTKLAQG
jgi:hypothetical protein